MARTISLDFKSQFDKAALQNFISEIRKQMDSVNFGDAIKRDLTKNMADIEKIMNKISTFSFKGRDVGGFRSLVSELNGQIAQIESRIGAISEKDFDIKFDDTGIKEVQDKIKALEQYVRDFKQESQNLLVQKVKESSLSREIKSAITDVASLQSYISNTQHTLDTLTLKDIIPEHSFAQYKDYLRDIEATKARKEEILALERETTNMTKAQKTQAARSLGFANYTELKKQLSAMQTAIKLEAQYQAKFNERRQQLQETITALNTILATSQQEPQAIQQSQDELSQLRAELVRLQELSQTEFMAEQRVGIEGMQVAVSNTTPLIQNATEEANRFGVAVDRAAGQEAARRVEQFAVKWLGIGMAMRQITKIAKEAWQTYRDLDTQITSIAMVTGRTLSDTWKDVSGYTQTARNLGITTRDVAKQSEEFYRQGLNQVQTMQMIEGTTKMAAIANMDYGVAVDYMTAAINGFKLESSDAIRVSDLFSKVDAAAAVSVEELAVALSKTASIAKSAGMEIETTTAFIAKMLETTREAPENIGTAMKSIIARMAELKESPLKVMEEGVDVNKVEAALRTAQVALRDTVGEFRDLDDVLLELGSKWDGLSRNTQRYIATMVAGNRQQSRFIALMDDYSRTTELVDIANSAAGTSTVAFQKRLESLDAAINQVKTSWEAFYLGGELIGFFTGLMQGLAETIQTFADLGIVGTAITAIIVLLIAKMILYTISTVAATKATDRLTIAQWANNVATTAQSGGFLGLVGALVSYIASAITGKAVTLSLTGALAALQMAFPPLLIISAVAAAIIGIVYAATNGAREIRKFNEELQKLNAIATESQAEYDNSRKLIDSYMKLETEVNKTTEQKEKQVEVANELAEIYPQLVDYYNEEGNAILKNAKYLQEFVRLQEQMAITAKKEHNVKQLEGFTKGIDQATQEIKQYRKELQNAEMDLQYLQYELYTVTPEDGYAKREYTYAPQFFMDVEEMIDSAETRAMEYEDYMDYLYQQMEIYTNTKLKQYEDNVQNAQNQIDRVERQRIEDLKSIISSQSTIIASEVANDLYWAGEELNEGQEKLFKEILRQDYMAEYERLLEARDEEGAKALATRLSANIEDEITNAKHGLAKSIQSIADENIVQQIIDALTSPEDVSLAEFRQFMASDVFANLPQDIQEALAEKEQEIIHALNDSITHIFELTNIPEATIRTYGDEVVNILATQLEKIDGADTRATVATAFNNLFKRAMGEVSLDEEGIAQVGQILGQIDPSSIESIAKARMEIAHLLGLPYDSAKIVDLFGDIDAGATATVQTIDELVEGIGYLYSHMGEITDLAAKNIAGTLQQGDMETLLNLFPELTSLDFTATADGLQLVGYSVEELTQRFYDNRIELFNNARVTAEKTLADRQAALAILESIDTTNMSKEALEAHKQEVQKAQAEVENLTTAIHNYSLMIDAMPKPDFALDRVKTGINVIKDYVDTMQSVVAAVEQFNEVGEVSLNNVIALADANVQYLSALEITNGQIHLNVDALMSLAEAQVSEQKAALLARASEIEGENVRIEARIRTLSLTLQILKSETASNEEKANAVKSIWQSEGEFLQAINEAKQESTEQTELAITDAIAKSAAAQADTLSQEMTNVIEWAKTYTEAINGIINGLKKLDAAEKGVAFETQDLAVQARQLGVDFGSLEFDAGEQADFVGAKVKEILESQNEEAKQAFMDELENQIALLESQYEINAAAANNLRQLADIDWYEKFAKTGGDLAKGAKDAKKEVDEFKTSLEAAYNVLREIALIQQKINELGLRAELAKTGYEAQQYIEAQIREMERELKLYEEAIKIQEQQMNELRQALMAQYAQFVSFIGDMLVINYQAIAAAAAAASTKEEIARLKTLEEMISAYNKLQDAVNGYRQSQLNLQKQMRDMERERQQKVFDMENRLLQALIARDEKELDQLRKKYDKMKAMDISYLEAVKRMREKEKKLREQEKDLTNLAKLKQRLALLERDTSGAYAKEIAELREQIAEAEMEMSEQAKDQIIADMEDEMNERHNKYDEDVDALAKANEAKKENMQLYWDEVYAIMDAGVDAMLDVLMSYDEQFLNMSERQKNQWIEDMRKAAEEVEAILSGISLPDYGDGDGTGGGGTGGGTGGAKPPTTGGGGGRSGGVGSDVAAGTTLYSTAADAKNKTNPKGNKYPDEPMEVIRIDSKTGSFAVRYKKLKSGTTGWVPAFKKGGMVDFTGPAWVDGSKSKPEAFLSADDTEMMRRFLDILGGTKPSILTNPTPASSVKALAGDINRGGGETAPITIEVNVDKLDSDYGVDRMIDRVQERLLEIGQYRNTITIRGTR